MYVALVNGGRRLVTSDAQRLCLYDLGDGRPRRVTQLDQPGELPYFEQSPAGERLTHGGGGGGGGGIVARSFTPCGRSEHWTEAPTSVGLYAEADLSTIAVLDLQHRLDHESLALSPDGLLIASVSRGSGPIVFDARTGEQRWVLPGEIASGVSWSPDGRWLALGETGQADGELTLVDTQPTSGGKPIKHVLPHPQAEIGLYDSPFRSMFSRDGRWVVFTSASWGVGGVSVYDVATRQERWSVDLPTTDEEEAESWPAPEVDLAQGDGLVLVGQDGRVQAFRATNGDSLSRLEHERADARYFAADSARRGLWVTRGGEPVLVPFPDDWR
jgi:WD40 repeat protein